MLPCPIAASSGRTAEHIRIVPLRWTSSTCSNTAESSSSNRRIDHPCAIDQDIERRQLAYELSDGLAHIEEAQFRPGNIRIPGQRIDLALRHTRHSHVGTGKRKRPRRRRPDPRCAPSHQHPLARIAWRRCDLFDRCLQ